MSRWRPVDISGAPIPTYFDYEKNELPVNPTTRQEYPIYYLGRRFQDSLDMHKQFANKPKMLGPEEIPGYNFKFPPHQCVLDAMSEIQRQQQRKKENLA